MKAIHVIADDLYICPMCGRRLAAGKNFLTCRYEGSRYLRSTGELLSFPGQVAS